MKQKIEVVIDGPYNGKYEWGISMHDSYTMWSNKTYSRKRDAKVGAYRALWMMQEKLVAGDIKCVDSHGNPA